MKITNEDIPDILTTIGKTFKVLNSRERKILRLRYGLEDGELRTLEQVAKKEQAAKKEKVTRERIRQVESRALKKISLILDYEK